MRVLILYFLQSLSARWWKVVAIRQSPSQTSYLNSTCSCNDEGKYTLTVISSKFY